MSPVDPAVASTCPAPSVSRLQVLFAHPMSNSSVRGAPGAILLLDVLPKNPSTSSFGAVVVTVGATIEPLRDLTAPLCESIGDVVSTPLTSMTDAPADV